MEKTYNYYNDMIVKIKELEGKNKELKLENKELKEKNNKLQDDVNNFYLKKKEEIDDYPIEIFESEEEDIIESEEDKEFKIIQEYYNLLKKDWVQELCDSYISRYHDCERNNNNKCNVNSKNTISNIKVINNSWYHEENDKLLKLHIKNNKLEQVYPQDRNSKLENLLFKINLIYNWEKGKINNYIHNEYDSSNMLFTNYLYLKMMNKT